MSNVPEAAILNAFEGMVTRYAALAPGSEAEVRDNWPRDKLLQERAEVWFNEGIFTLRAASGFGSLAHPDAYEVDLDPNVDDADLGASLSATLANSRELTLRDLESEIRAWSQDEVAARYQLWLNRFMSRHQVKSRRALFKNMRLCHVLSRDGLLTMSPTNHDRLEGWSGSGLPANAIVSISASSPLASIGMALRQAMGNCLNTYRG